VFSQNYEDFNGKTMYQSTSYTVSILVETDVKYINFVIFLSLNFKWKRD